MIKRLLLVILLAGFFSLPRYALASDTISTGRIWTYVNVMASVHENWTLSLMPGHRYEYTRSEGDELKTFLYELMVGAIYKKGMGPVTFTMPVYYYYMQWEFDSTIRSHNALLMPAFSYRYGNWTFSERTILHNKFYTDLYEDNRFGYSMLWRQMIKVAYSFTDSFSLFAANDLFIGAIEDGETVSAGEPGFERRGITANRFYLGTRIAMGKGVSLVPQYILQTDFDEDVNVVTQNHYIQLTVNYWFKLLNY